MKRGKRIRKGGEKGSGKKRNEKRKKGDDDDAMLLGRQNQPYLERLKGEGDTGLEKRRNQLGGEREVLKEEEKL